jgi:hypothetical protein
MTLFSVNMKQQFMLYKKLHSYEASIIYFSTSKKGKIKELEKLLQKYTIFTGASNISYKILCWIRV